MTNKFYQVIPLIKLPLRSESIFTYHSTEDIPLLSIVEVVFGQKKIPALVFKKEKNKPDFKTKPILKISPIIISPKQLSLAKKISDYYLSPLSKVLKSFIPPALSFPKKQALLAEKKADSNFSWPALTNTQKNIFKKITAIDRPVLLSGPAGSGKTEIIFHLIKKLIVRKKQGLIIIPEIFLSFFELQRYRERFPQLNIALFNGNLKSSEKNRIWHKIKTGEIDLIIGTRVALFLPFSKLSLIVIDEEQDSSHKQWDLSPFYHARQVGKFLAEIHQAKIILISATPSLESSVDNQLAKVKLPALTLKKNPILKPNIIIDDLKQDYFKRKKGDFLTKNLINQIELALKNKKVIFLFSNYRGHGRTTICLDCLRQIKCPNCDTPLIKMKEKYRCLHCSYEINDSFVRCPKCRSFRLANIGNGGESIATAVRKKFPKAKIKLINRSTEEKNHSFEQIATDLRSGKIDILIGTQIISKGIDLPNLGLVSLIESDSLFSFADFRTDERGLGLIFQLFGRLGRPGSTGQSTFLLQTFQEKRMILNFLKKESWKEFIKEELSTRQELFYPPYSRLIKIIFKEIKQKEVEKKALKFYNNLVADKISLSLKISGPYPGKPLKIRNQYRYIVLIKTKQISQALKNFIIKNETDMMRIDVDPESIF